jgi:hypothetical protein
MKYCTFSCDNDDSKVTPLNGGGKVTGATIFTSFFVYGIIPQPTLGSRQKR